MTGGEHLEATHRRHSHVSQDDVGRQRLDLIQALLSAERDVWREAFVLEKDA
jgi:hypothetical protein